MVLILLVFLALSLNVQIAYASESYTLNGPYFESGDMDYSGVNCTFYRENQAPQVFFLNGTTAVTANQAGIVFQFAIGYNVSRTYYVHGSETIYVIKPSEPFYVYYIEVDDLLGIQWGYLESMINLGGTDRVVERWDCKNVKGELPFTLTWGKAYKLRLVCNKGTYVYGSFVAGATDKLTLAITQDMFPSVPADRAFSINAYRYNDSIIKVSYSDSQSKTNWVQFQIYESGATNPVFTYNTTSQTFTYEWNEAASDADYYVKITLSHQYLGTLIYSYACSAPAPVTSNPWVGLRILGTFPIDPAQIPALIIILCVFGIFSWWSAPIGIISMTMITMLMRYLNWIDIPWTWLALAVPLDFLIAFIMWKEREPTV